MKGKNHLKTVLTILLSLAFAAFFLWIALRGIDFETVQKSIAKANYFWVAAAGFFGVLAYWLRAVRWNLLLEPMGHKISNANAFYTISFGYLMNLTIPRSGEVARATALYGVEKVPVDQSFGTIILERVVDFVCLLGFLGLALIFKYDAILAFYRFVTESKSEESRGTPSVTEEFLLKIGIEDFASFFLYLKIVIVLVIASAAIFLYQKKKAQLLNFAKGLWKGVTSIFKLREKGKFIFYTLGIWISYFLASYLICFALPETSQFTIADGFFIIAIGTFGMIVPASGGIGAFNLAMKYGFMALFVGAGKSADLGGEIGLTYSFISLPLQIVITLVLGLIAIPILAKSGKNTEVIQTK